MRAAIYIRVSTEDQVRYGYSLAEQEEACRHRAADLGAETAIVFPDEGISGSTLDRPGLSALREAVRSRQIDLIVIRDPDRLSRKLAHQLLLTEEIEKAGVKLEFLDFDWQDTPEGRLFYSIRGAVAEFEREKIRDRMQRGKTQKAKQGGIPVCFSVFGYSYETETGKVSVLEEESSVVLDIFNWFTTEDIGVNGVAKKLNHLGVPTRKNRRWHRVVIRQILKNPVYKGSWKYKDTYIPVPAIVDESIWDKAQERLKEARRLWAGNGIHNYLLSGLVTCADCGNTMTGAYTKWWGKRERRYTCRKTREQGAKNEGCQPVKAVLAATIEEAVWKQVCEWLYDPELLARDVAETSPQAEGLQQELNRVDKHLADVDKGREAVLTALASGLFELDNKTKEKLFELKRRKERLELRRKELIAALHGAELAQSRVEEIKTFAKDVLSKLDSMDFSGKKALIRVLVSQVSVSGRGTIGANGLKNMAVTVVVRLPEPETATIYTICDR